MASNSGSSHPSALAFPVAGTTGARLYTQLLFFSESTSSHSSNFLDELSYPGSSCDPVPSAGLGFRGGTAPETRAAQQRLDNSHVLFPGLLPIMGAEVTPTESGWLL